MGWYANLYFLNTILSKALCGIELRAAAGGKKAFYYAEINSELTAEPDIEKPSAANISVLERDIERGAKRKKKEG